MTFFPGTFNPDATAISNTLGEVKDWFKQMFAQMRKNSKLVFTAITIFASFVSLILVLIVILSDVPMPTSKLPTLANALWWYRIDFSKVPMSHFAHSSGKQVETLSETGLSNFYTICAASYCSETECTTYSPFYFDAQKLIQDNLNKGYSMTLPIGIAAKATFVRNMSIAVWVLLVIGVSLHGVGFFGSFGMLKSKRIALMVGICISIASAFIGASCIMSTVLTIIYTKTIFSFVKSYGMIIEIGSAGFGLFYCACVLLGLASVASMLLVRKNKKEDRRNLEYLIERHQQQQQQEHQQLQQQPDPTTGNNSNNNNQEMVQRNLSTRPYSHQSPQVSEDLQNRNISAPRYQHSTSSFRVLPKMSSRTLRNSSDGTKSVKRKASAQTTGTTGRVSTDTAGTVTMVHNGRTVDNEAILEPQQYDNEPRHLQNAQAIIDGDKTTNDTDNNNEFNK